MRALLRENRPTRGTRVSGSWPFFTEIVGATGLYDYVEFLAEYAPFSQDDLENIARAAELHGMASMIKVDYQNRGYVAQRAIASGFQAINFTDHHTAEEVRETVQLIKPDTEADGGHFGFPNRRFIGCTPYIDQLAHAQRLRDVVLCFMIEKQDAVKNIEEICSVPGVDMVQFGPSDYCMSRGWLRKDHVEESRAAERLVIETALRHGVAPRCEIGSAQDAQYYIDLGVRHFCLGDQMQVMRNFLTREGGILNDKIQTL